CRDLQGRFIETTWTRATRQQKSDKQKGQRPDFRPHYAPSRYWKAPSYKSMANNERLAIASLFPRPTSSVRHTRADCATSFALRDRARASRRFPRNSEGPSPLILRPPL